VHAFAVRAEQVEELDRRRPGVAQGVRDARVELGGLAGVEQQVMVPASC